MEMEDNEVMNESGDERTYPTKKTASRTKRVADSGREDRGMQNREVTENRALSDDERVALYRQQFHQDILPSLPEIPNYHVCWLTTSNPRDSINTRMRLGYEPVRAEDVPGFEAYSMKTGEWAGFIGVNEMLAFKLPMSLYQRYMNEAHNIAPYREQERITSVIDQMQDDAQRQGGNIIEDEGYAELRRSPSRVTFD